MDDTLIFDARARVLADLQARGHATPGAVSLLEDAVSSRTWWAEQWPEGVVYVAGLVAQDVQDALLEQVGRWPLCLGCGDAPEHALYIHPDLGGRDRGRGAGDPQQSWPSWTHSVNRSAR